VSITHAVFNRFEVRLPSAAVEECAHPGPCDADVSRWAPKIAELNPGIRPEDVRAELKEYGAWEAADLADDVENWERLVWIAACNVKEENP
jgi:hypothetical protein